ncbi:uncharacterized protein LOC113228278 [Hyposmocoma kahamanoa]|uniref:uncharacterized protein LOC113228278 n=1 Tax=Hyposmocoma kahamanoa TaxID=1477025 RepID=UPI000E6D7111|nr:uncharacterized protein LOC113228278 [Hyposmocoma kahamanoa]
MSGEYGERRPNNTNINSAFGYYFSKAILKRILRDYEAIIPQEQFNLMKDLIFKAEYLLSHYVYNIRNRGWDDAEYRISILFKEDVTLVHSIGKFNRNKLKKWILSELQINNYTEEMDRGTLSRIKYVDLIESILIYNITIHDSDECISRISKNPEPIHVQEMKPCRPDPYCFAAINSEQSVAYGLSHRLVNNFMYYYIRRCYLYSELEDVVHMEMLCSFMYREAVYLARKGYFARDLFVEHIALCAALGYEEFIRKHWFLKIGSWIDNNGCVAENRNLEINRTEVLMLRTKDAKKIAKLKGLMRKRLEMECDEHLMALTLIAFAHAVRHGVHNLRQQKIR